MKNMKKYAALLLAGAMACAMPTAVMAADHTINVGGSASTATHTYEILQIMTGDISDGQVISNAFWGGNASKTGAVADEDLTVLTGVAGSTDAAKLEKILPFVDLTSTAFTTVTNNGSVTVPEGYYLVRDKAGTLAGANDAYTTYIVKVADDFTITPKTSVPSVDKQILDEAADAESGSTDGWGETADHAINETFQFKLNASIPADVKVPAYEKYKVIFTDTMSAGVTFEKINSVTVKAGTETKTLTATQYDCTATAGQAGGSWTLTIADIKNVGLSATALAGEITVEVEYDAHLNESAQIDNANASSTTNENTVSLQYSNNPNTTGSGAGEETGETPEDHVWAFTYEVDNVKKIGDTDTILAGAGFRLYDAAGTTEIALIYDSTLGAYRPVKGTEAGVEMKSAESTGKFDIKGLDAGTYTLKETTVPTGYNKCADITVTVSATHAEAATGASASMTLSDTSTMSNVVKNFAGTQLPETGGVGTTMIYLGGTCCVLGAGVLLYTKKRMATK